MLCRSCIPRTSAASSSRVLATAALRLAHTHALRHSSLLMHSPPHPVSPSSQARELIRTRSAQLSTTSRRSAEEVSQESMQALFDQQQRFLKLMQEKPELMDNIKGFVQLLKDNGVDVSSGQMPSKMDMLRLMMKKEVRESAMGMAAALQEAGIDLQKPDMMQSLMSMQKLLKGGK